MPIQMPRVNTQFFPFNGGLDLVTPPIQMFNGSLRFSSNVELGIHGGYTRCAGYERYSGKLRPSDASYSTLSCTITGTVNVNDVLTDNAGTSFGTVIAISGSTVVLTLLTGSFSAGNIKVGGVTQGTCAGAETAGGASTPALNASYTALAANVYRALIAVVPGSGNVLGVHQYSGLVYAVRNNAGGTAAVLHKSSASGWTAIALGKEMSFTSGGVYEVVEGNTITGATSGATAVITRVALTSGTWAAGTAAGTFIFASQTGNFVAENLNVGANLNVATVAANSSSITLPPNGRYEFQNHNFGGQAGTLRMYGCNGVGRGFEFDGTVFVPIHTGMTVDTPIYLRVHKNQLFFVFGSSVQHSGVGTPYIFSPLFGASELAVGDTITGLVELPGSVTSGALAIYTKNTTSVLYGNDVSDWNLVQFSNESGGIAYTTQYIRTGMALDSQGIIGLSTSQKFGNFESSIISDKITPFLSSKITTAIASCVVRKKNQYRLFFTTGEVITVSYLQEQIQGVTVLTLNDDVTCISSLEGATGEEEIYFGSSDGFVYQAEIGTSFDGDAIVWSAELAFNHFGGPRQLKQFRKAVMEVTGVGYSEFSFATSLSYGSNEFASSASSTAQSDLQPVTWDSFIWDQFFWDGRSLSPSEADITGTAENLSLLFSGDSDAFPSFTLNSAIIHYTPRRLMR